MTQMAMDTFAFIVDLPPDAETKTSQQQMQVLETVMRTEEGEEKMKRIEEIKNELKDSVSDKIWFGKGEKFVLAKPRCTQTFLPDTLIDPYDM